MDYRLEILRRETVRGKTNAVTETFVPVKDNVNAERVKLSGRFVTEAGDVFPDYHVEYIIHYPIEIEEGWHVREKGGHEYVVTSIIPNRRRNMKTLICERFNR